MTFGTLAWLLRASGWSLVLLGMLHAAFWKVFEWGDDSARLSPINRRVFIVHASFIVYVLIAFGVLLATRADLFIQKSDLARIVLAGMTLFFALRALAQPLVFDPVLAVGWRWRSVLQAVAMLAFLTYVGVFALAWAHQSGALDNPIWKFEANSLRSWLRIGIASVWLMFGLAFKALNLVPRHRLIVRRILGESVAGPATLLIALGECSLGLWMLSGLWLQACVAIQTAAIVTMNALEIRYARELLLSPPAMLMANTVLLSVAWYVALGS